MSATINSSVNGYSSVDSRHRSGRGMGRPSKRESTGRTRGHGRRTCAARVVTMVDRAGLGHIGGDLSVTDILVTLFGAVLDVDPTDPTRAGPRPLHPQQGPLRRRALRHARPLRLLPARRAEPRSWRRSRRSTATRTAPRCRAWRPTPARSATASRSRVGCALAAKLRGLDYRTFVVLGDGELQEGSNWEAAMTAAHYDLDNLTAIVDRNRLQQGARTEDTKQLEPLADKWVAFGFETRVIDGHDYAQLLEALAPRTHRPARRRHRQHDQGQGRLLHGGPRRVAPQGAERRAGRARPRGARPDDHQLATDAQTYDCRKAFAETLIELARADERIVAVCNDSVGSSNLVGFREEFPDRLINVGIAEQDLVGVGAGLANGGLDPVRLRRRAVPDRPRARADQGRRRLLQHARDPLRPEPGHGLRRARPDAPLDRGPLAGCARSTTSTCSSRPTRARPAPPCAGRSRTPARCTCACRASRSPRSRPEDAVLEPGRAVRLRDGDDVTVVADRDDGLARARRRRARCGPTASRRG